MRFADYMSSNTSAASSASVEDEALASLHQYRVGLKVLYAQADGQTASPSSVPPLCTVYYPTNESPTAERRGALPLHVPFGDSRVRAEFKRRHPSMWVSTLHFDDARILAKVDAALALSPDATVGSAAHPVIIFSPDIGLYSHMYSAFMMDLVAHGAIVLAVHHADGGIPRASTPDVSVLPFVDSNQPPLRFDNTRVPDVKAVMAAVHSGRLHALLGVPHPRDEATKFCLVGHGYGGTTVLSTALLEFQWNTLVQAVVAIDFRAPPDLWMPRQAAAFARSSSRNWAPPPLVFMDSQESDRAVSNRHQEELLVRLWPSKATRTWTQGTDRLTVTDVAYLINVPFVRKPYKTCCDRRQTALWAAATIAAIHRS